MQAVPPPNRNESITLGYRAQTCQIVARRMPLAIVIFLVFVGMSHLLDWLYHPARGSALLATYAVYLAICATQLGVARLLPARNVWVTVIACNALMICLGEYYAAVHGNADVLVVILLLFLSGLAVLYPWGARGQLLASTGALGGYLLAAAAGLSSSVPTPYHLLGISAVLVIGALGAHLFDTHRFSTYCHAIDLAHANEVQREEQAFSTALLQVGRALQAAIDDPHTLAQQLIEQTRQVLSADWAVLYQANQDGSSFRATALSEAPHGIIDEVHAVEYRPGNSPDFTRLLVDKGAVELWQQQHPRFAPSVLLQRWNVGSAILQAIKRDEEMMAFVLCCYTQRCGPVDPLQRRILAGIAIQAAVALENARLMEEARAANRIKSEFVATMSHELRTPLNVILGYTDLLVDGAFDPPSPTQLDTLQRIRQQSAQLLDLIQGMLDLNRLEARGFPVQVESFTLGEVLNSLRANIPAAWCKSGVQLEWLPANEQTVLHSDRGKVEMILRNLIHNALKYTDQGAVRVAAELQPQDERVCFAVSDTGPGIAGDEHSAIFEMFRQGTTTRPRGSGVGLGLYIVKRLTEALGGDISVESRAGSGARFVVSLPASMPRQPAVA